MSLSTEPFAAPSTRPQTVVLQRAEDPEPDRPPRRVAVLAASVGTLALGAVAVGVAVTGSSDVGAPASLAPAAGAAMTLVPPAVGAPIVPPTVTPPAVTTREAPVVERSATSAPRRERPRSVPAEVREARELVAVIKQRAREVRKEARERAADRRAHRHAPHGR